VKKAEPAPPRPPAPRPATKPTPPEPAKPAKPVEVAKEEPAKKPTTPKPPTPEKAKVDFDALLASVEAQNKRVREPEKREARGVAAERGGTSSPGEARQAQANPSALIAAINDQVTPCWNIPLAAQGVGGLRAEVQIVLGPDGSARTVEAVDTARMASDPLFRTFAESAIRAVRACSPLKLPPEQYQVWRNVIINFDPSLLTG
jgi:outer membrane biosynthesis protein TonB